MRNILPASQTTGGRRRRIRAQAAPAWRRLAYRPHIWRMLLHFHRFAAAGALRPSLRTGPARRNSGSVAASSARTKRPTRHRSISQRCRARLQAPPARCMICRHFRGTIAAAKAGTQRRLDHAPHPPPPARAARAACLPTLAPRKHRIGSAATHVTRSPPQALLRSPFGP
jgi:hypothetical protein